MAYLGVWQNAKALCNFDGLGSCGSYVYLEDVYLRNARTTIIS
jgi:hypothetical protein